MTDPKTTPPRPCTTPCNGTITLMTAPVPGPLALSSSLCLSSSILLLPLRLWMLLSCVIESVPPSLTQTQARLSMYFNYSPPLPTDFAYVCLAQPSPLSCPVQNLPSLFYSSIGTTPLRISNAQERNIVTISEHFFVCFA